MRCPQEICTEILYVPEYMIRTGDSGGGAVRAPVAQRLVAGHDGPAFALAQRAPDAERRFADVNFRVAYLCVPANRDGLRELSHDGRATVGPRRTTTFRGAKPDTPG